MIQTLHISNYALIDKLNITLHNGLNILTGETGAGKSIILGALSLLLGGRSDTKAVRNHDVKSVIEATFTASGHTALAEYCTSNEIDWDNDSVILRREIAPTGRSRAFINDCPVNLTQLQSAALQLIDIHSQHQNLLLASPPYQLRVIDSLANNGELLQTYTDAYNNYRHAVRLYKQERKAMEQAKDDEEFLRFQYKRLKDANLQPGEQDALEHERELLVNMADVKASLQSIMANLTDGEDNVERLLRQTIDEAERLDDFIEDADNLTERLRAIRIELQDIADTFSAHDRELGGDPERLEEVEDRLNLIYELTRRHKVETVDELITIRNDMKQRLQGIDLGDETLQALEQEAKRAKKEALALAAEISTKRHEEAERFALILKERAVPLGMKNLQCQIVVRDTELSATGIDHVEFLFAFNKNQPLLPVGNTASGGEISRLMLSIKSIVADKMELPSIIFDEVDTGVSGDVADKMGGLMRQIASNIQVIAITHLPQVASKGNCHYKVFKEDTENATVTRIKELNFDERVKELAVMLSGSSVNEAALANARVLLTSSQPQNDKQ